ncbi:MAG: type II secretion system GspH family protein [Planctomycetota bacterium]|nr:type II secretion system GspH family protein [Planctomycetota bacterium]
MRNAAVVRGTGLTLIELLVVLAILVAISGMVISMTDTMDSRNRYEETARRLAEIRSAVLGPDAVSADGELLSGGYLQDIGWLPDSAADLLRPPEIAAGKTMPKLTFYSEWKTWAGWRGPYLAAPPIRRGETAPILYDDYGNEFYGWFAESTAQRSWALLRLSGDFAIRSPGSDGKKDSDGGRTGIYERDYPDAGQPLIPEADWVSDITGLSVKVVNLTANDYTSTRVRFRVAVPRWDRSPPLGYSDGLDSDPFASVGFELGVGPAGGLPGSNQRICDFMCNSGCRLQVPHGRRILFLVRESDGQPLPGVRACTELRLSRRLSPPSCVTLEIRN